MDHLMRKSVGMGQVKSHVLHTCTSLKFQQELATQPEL